MTPDQLGIIRFPHFYCMVHEIHMLFMLNIEPEDQNQDSEAYIEVEAEFKDWKERNWVWGLSFTFESCSRELEVWVSGIWAAWLRLRFEVQLVEENPALLKPDVISVDISMTRLTQGTPWFTGWLNQECGGAQIWTSGVAWINPNDGWSDYDSRGCRNCLQTAARQGYKQAWCKRWAGIGSFTASYKIP